MWPIVHFNLTAASPVTRFPFRLSRPSNKQCLTVALAGSGHSLHSHVFSVFSRFPLSDKHPTSCACKWIVHTQAFSHSAFAVHWCATLCSRSHNLRKHFYSWFLCREWLTVNTLLDSTGIFLCLEDVCMPLLRLCNVYWGSVHEYQGFMEKN